MPETVKFGPPGLMSMSWTPVIWAGASPRFLKQNCWLAVASKTTGAANENVEMPFRHGGSRAKIVPVSWPSPVTSKANVFQSLAIDTVAVPCVTKVGRKVTTSVMLPPAGTVMPDGAPRVKPGWR
jgi:hypothetical protein